MVVKRKWNKESTRSGKEMRYEGLMRLGYYVRDMVLELEKTFRENEGFEELCEEICHSRGIEWNLVDWREDEFKSTPETFLSFGKRFRSMGSTLTEVSVDTDLAVEEIESKGYKSTVGEDVGFYLSEMGIGLEGLSALWRVVDPDMEYDLDRVGEY